MGVHRLCVSFPSRTPWLSNIDSSACPQQSTNSLVRLTNNLEGYIAPDFWDTFCSSSGRLILSHSSTSDQCDYIDLRRYTIIQCLKLIYNAVTESGRASPSSLTQVGLSATPHTDKLWHDGTMSLGTHLCARWHSIRSLLIRTLCGRWLRSLLQLLIWRVQFLHSRWNSALLDY